MSSSRQHVHDDQWSGNLETTRAERSLWLMKCPLMVSKTWQEQTRAHNPDSSHLPILAKVVRSIDPLRPQNSSSVEIDFFVKTLILPILERMGFVASVSLAITGLARRLSLIHIPGCPGISLMIGRNFLTEHPIAEYQRWSVVTEGSEYPIAEFHVSVLDEEYIMDLVGVPGNAGDAGDEGVNVPKFYKMNMAEDIIPLCVFSESNQGKVSMEGKVEHKFDMKPSNTGDPEYHKICRVRKKKSEVKARQTQLIHNDRGELMRPMPGMVGLLPSNSKDKKKTTPMKGSDMKRTRRDRSELENIMFKLFERQPNWALKQLVQETDQPAVIADDSLEAAAFTSVLKYQDVCLVVEK
ncbi:hypothetical protein ACLOJK_020864 [Asimina triloba]